MTGFELVDQLRAIPTLEQTPIILMNARMPRDGVKQRQLQAIRKPFDLNELMQLIREQLLASDELLFSACCRFRCASSQQVLHRFLLPFIEIGACQQAQVEVPFPP